MKTQSQKQATVGKGERVPAEAPSHQAEGSLGSDESYRLLVETLRDYAILMLDPEGRVATWNPGAERFKGYRADEIIGKHVSIFYPAEAMARDLPRIELEGATKTGVYEDVGWRVRKDGSQFWASVVISALRTKDGVLIGFSKVTKDLTLQRAAEARIKRQSDEILELATPVMQVWKGVVMAPLIGSLDSARTQQFMERLLNRVVETNSSVALVDIMGVPTIDTKTAQHLIESITAVRLLGAQVVLTGVRPAIAQTLVHLGINLSDILTRSSLAGGLQVALNILKLEVVAKSRGLKE